MSVKQRIQTSVRFLVLSVMALSVAFVPLTPAVAVESNTSSNTLKVTPVRTDIQIAPGESGTVRTTVTNLTQQDLRITPEENDFIAGDERGTPSLILDADEFAPTHSLKRFMKPLDQVTIPAGETAVINVEINVPKDAQAGGYFGAVRFVPSALDDGSQVNLNASVASLILLTVPGDLVEKLNLTEFNVLQNGKAGEFFQTPDKITANFRFENKGNVQTAPVGKISVKKGDKVVYETDFNNKDQKDVILPDSARRWDVPLKNIEGFGHYTVSATLTYGGKNQTIEMTKSFWVIPLAVLIGGIVGLLVLIALIVGIWWFLKGYKKRILRNQDRGRAR